jgi:type IV pilus assembly protein PilY1
VAELPLKASVLAKPNVVFGMDDSGSMDSEVMIDGTFQGWFYGNYQSTDLYPGGNRRTGAATYDWALFYLFPNGTGSGNRIYADLMPTTTTRSRRPMRWPGRGRPTTTRIYYDSNKTYTPWSPGYVSGASASTFGNAASTSATRRTR